MKGQEKRRDVEKERHEARALAKISGSRRRGAAGQATFALVSEDGGEVGSAGIELVLRDGRWLRISKGVDEQTLRTAVWVLGEEC